MKIKTTSLITITSFLIFSCGNKEEKKDVKKIAIEKKTDGNYISKKWKGTKEIFVDSDSIINARKTNYFENQRKKYPEYASVQKWFESNPKELFGLKGDYYKMLKATIADGDTKNYKDLTALSEAKTYQYIYITGDAFFILDLSTQKDVVNMIGSRRIQKGYGTEPMYDLFFDSKKNLTKEAYLGDVEQDLFTKNGHIYFEFKKEINDSFVSNTIDLGTERDF